MMNTVIMMTVIWAVGYMVYMAAKYFNPFEREYLGYARMQDHVLVTQAICEDDDLNESDVPLALFWLDVIDFAKGMIVPSVMTILYLAIAG